MHYNVVNIYPFGQDPVLWDYIVPKTLLISLILVTNLYGIKSRFEFSINLYNKNIVLVFTDSKVIQSNYGFNYLIIL